MWSNCRLCKSKKLKLFELCQVTSCDAVSQQPISVSSLLTSLMSWHEHLDVRSLNQTWQPKQCRVWVLKITVCNNECCLSSFSLSLAQLSCYHLCQNVLKWRKMMRLTSFVELWAYLLWITTLHARQPGAIFTLRGIQALVDQYTLVIENYSIWNKTNVPKWRITLENQKVLFFVITTQRE